MLVTILASIGTGSALTCIIKWALERHDKKNTEIRNLRRSVFERLLACYAESAKTPCRDAAIDFALAEALLHLVASASVIDAVKQLKNSDANTTDREQAQQMMLDRMRQDLGL